MKKKRSKKPFSGARVYVMRSIDRSIRTRGYPPTEKEIANDLRCSQTNISAHVRRLIDGGLLARASGPRSLAITPAGLRALKRPAPQQFAEEVAVEKLEFGA